jgi:hypothetical protein
MYGPQIGPVLFSHAQNEQSFKANNIEGGNQKMTELDSEFANDEMRAVAMNIKKSTSLLVRYFHKNNEAYLKLQSQSDTRSAELTQFIEFFQSMRDLQQILLTTPKEEQDSMLKNIQIYLDSVKELMTTKDNRQESL